MQQRKKDERLKYGNTHFLTSATTMQQCPPDRGYEVAFVGRSNAGKSTLINVLCGQVKLAKVAKAPGRTRMLNFFAVNDRQHRLVDLPGYGYARVSQTARKHWDALLTVYFSQRQSLRGMVLVVDIRRQLTALDWQMLDWCQHVCTHIVVTKADKLKRQQQQTALTRIEEAISNQKKAVTLQLFSSKNCTGVETLRARLDGWFASGA